MNFAKSVCQESAKKRKNTETFNSSNDELNNSLALDEKRKENEMSFRKKKKVNKWSTKETLYLVYFVHLMGRSWVEIFLKYEKYFENRTAQDLCNKYVKLEKDVVLLEEYKEQAELLLGDEIEISEKKLTKYDKWDDDEVTSLLQGVEKYGRNWVCILEVYKNNFKKHRDAKGLHSKYKSLEKNRESFLSFKRKAGILLDECCN